MMRTANQTQRTYRKRNGNGSTPTGANVVGPRRAVVYVRISKHRDNETSTESQERICRDWCARHGIEVVAVFVDSGESAFANKAPRAEFKRALDMVRTHAANTMVVYKLDRFMRDASTAVRVRDDVHTWNGSLVSATEGIDTADRSNPVSGIVFMILAQLAEMESQTKSDRIRDWHHGNIHREDGALPPGGPRPYGYERARNTNDDPTLVVCEDEARTIHDAARMILNGMGLKGVAAELSTHGDKRFTRTGLKHILTSETTAGYRYDGTTHYKGNWTPILDDATWQLLCQTLNDPERLTAGPRGERRHLLSGMMHCGTCGNVMRMRTHYKGPRYGCTAAKCYNSIAVTQADAAVTDFVFASLDAGTWDALRHSGRGFDPAVVDGYKARLRKLTAMYAAGAMEDDEYETGREVINDQLRKAQETEYMELPDIADVRADWDRTHDDGTPIVDVDGKRLVISACLAHMRIGRMMVGAWSRGMAAHERIAMMPK